MMELTAKLLTSLNRRTRWTEGHIFAVTPEQIGIAEGLRASFAVAIMLAADLQLHIPDLAYGAVAAFWACLCDPGGPDRVRLRVIFTFAIEATLAISLAAYFAHWGMVAADAGLFLLVGLCGLTRSYRPTLGPMPAPGGLIAAIAAVIGVTSPRPMEGALQLAGCFLLGILWALVLCLFLWRTHPGAPARRALMAIFARLEEMARSLQELDRQNANDFNVGHRRAVRYSIERGREIVARLADGRARFGRAIDAAGRVFAALMAIGHQMTASGAAPNRTLLESLRRLLEEAARQAGRVAPDPDHLGTEAAALLGTASETRDRGISFAAGALADLARHWREPEPEEAGLQTPAGQLSFKVAPAVWRQALRVAIAVSISYALGAWYEVSFSYWGTIATLVLMQPFGANTWIRVLERAAGSMVGGVLAAILIARLSGPWEMLLFITPLTAAVIALRLVNYGLFVVFVTPMFILVSDFIHPASGLIASRAINEIIGACIGLAGSLLLWPEKEKDALSDAVLAAISANMAFASGMLRSPTAMASELDQLRRDAGMASSRAEIARQRLLLQGRSLDRVLEILVALRTVCGASNVVAITRQSGPEGCAVERAGRYDMLAELLRAEFTDGDVGAAIASFGFDDSDDLDRAIHSLTLAVQEYAAAK